MTQNLRIRGIVSSANSNFSSGSINVSRYDLKTNLSNECNNSNGYNNPCSRVPDSADMSEIGSSVTAKAFGAIKGGFYKTGTLSNATKGYFWSAANVNGVNRYDLAYDSSNGKFTGDDGSRRFNGQFVRCTKSSKTKHVL